MLGWWARELPATGGLHELKYERWVCGYMHDRQIHLILISKQGIFIKYMVHLFYFCRVNAVQQCVLRHSIHCCISII